MREDTPITAFNLEQTYLGLDGAGGVAKIPVGPDFWETIDKNPAARGTVVMQWVSTADWPHWEMHPNGDEVVCLVDGDVSMIFDVEGRDVVVPMVSGQTVVVPAGVWHRAIVARPSRMLFITYGEGTQHRAVER
ncbi:MAG: cupin domain-containing protein [Nitrospiraceae bacterium]|nr:cupin domain-containing protein [Nitrospiraceae bacterium]